MKKITELKSRNLRQDRNVELVRRMRNGEQLTSFDSQSSWYPPRPTIEKDPSAISKLYGVVAKASKADREAGPQPSKKSIEALDVKDDRLHIAD
jgi:hypothetical protein